MAFPHLIHHSLSSSVCSRHIGHFSSPTSPVPTQELCTCSFLYASYFFSGYLYGLFPHFSLLSDVAFVGKSSLVTVSFPHIFFLALTTTWHYIIYLSICLFGFPHATTHEGRKFYLIYAMIAVPWTVSSPFEHSINICWMNGWILHVSALILCLLKKYWILHCHSSHKVKMSGVRCHA